MAQTQFRSDDTVKWWLGFGDGSDGAYSSAGNATDAPIDSSCSGTAGATSLSATNSSFAAGKPVLIIQSRGTGAGNWELNQIQSYVAGTITLSKALINTYTDSGASQAQVIQLKQYSSFTQNSGHTLTVKAWDGNVGGIIAFLCKGTTTITGTLAANGGNNSGDTGGTGGGFRGGAGAKTGSQCGEGTGGDRTTSTSQNGNGGAGTNTDGSGGAGGGHAGAGGNGSVQGTAGGAAVGNVALTSLFFGGAGGGGNRNSDNAGEHAGGGGGGGICLIITKDFTISGAINVNGGNAAQTYWNGGAGAGGSVLVKAQTAVLGTNKITSSAGTLSGLNIGGTGSVGRIHLDYKDSYSGSTTPSIDVTQDVTLLQPSGSGALFFAQY